MGIANRVHGTNVLCATCAATNRELSEGASCNKRDTTNGRHDEDGGEILAPSTVALRTQICAKYGVALHE